MYIQSKKLYDAALGEPAGAIAEPAAPQINIASLMAAQGVMNSSSNPVATPIVITPENKGTPTANEPSQAATATEPQNATASPETPTPIAEPAPTPAPIAAEPVKVPTWQEVLRQQQPDTVLKELGVNEQVINLMNELKEADPKMVAFLQHWKSNGNVNDYLRELTTDYKAMSPEDLMRCQLQKDYPTASPQQLEALFKREVVKAYSLDSEDEDERNEGALLLQAKSEKHREQFIANQQKFLIPKPPEPKATAPDPREQEAERSFQQYQSQVNDNAYTKNIFANKQITIGEGEEQFNYPVDPAAITEMFFDDEKWASSLFTIKEKPGGGKDYIPDIEKHYLVGAVMKHGKDFIKAYGEHCKTLGAKAAITPIENVADPSKATPTAAQALPNNPAAAMARGGVFNRGGR